MKRILLVPIAMAFVAIGNASPICVQDTLANYIANNTACTIGDKLFTNWGYSSATTSATSITVVPQPGPNGGITDPGVLFSSGAWNAFPGETKDATITFTVSAPSGFHIEGAGLTIAGSVTGTGTGTVNEHLLNGVTDIPGSPNLTTEPSPVSAGFDFVVAGGTPMDTLNIQTLIHVSAAAGSHTTISAITEDFSQIQTVPEPAEAMLIGSGLLLFGFVWRKRSGR